jgi:hypothetical protein
MKKNILLRVVCDTMLQGLCKKLRMFGVDAVALGKTSYFHDCCGMWISIILMPIRIRLSILMPILIRIRIRMDSIPSFTHAYPKSFFFTVWELNILLPATYSCYFSENGQLHEDCLTIAAGSPGEIFILVVIT